MMGHSPLALMAISVLLGTPDAIRAECQFSVTRTERSITYRFQPEVTPGGLLLHVTLEFQAGADGRDTLLLPTHWAGEAL